MSEHESSSSEIMDVHRIMEMIPHRYPFLMIDKLIDVKKGESATGVKNVTINENFFQGHFPDRPVMPGVLIVEAMAQTAGCVVVDFLGKEAEGRLVYFMSIDNTRFRAPVGPGDVLHIKVAKQQKVRNVWKFTGKAFVGDKLCAQATFSAMIMDKE